MQRRKFPCFLEYDTVKEKITKTNVFQSDFFCRLEYFHDGFEPCSSAFLKASSLLLMNYHSQFANRMHPTIYHLNEFVIAVWNFQARNASIFCTGSIRLNPRESLLLLSLYFAIQTTSKRPLIFQYTYSLLFHTNLPFKSTERVLASS